MRAALALKRWIVKFKITKQKNAPTSIIVEPDPNSANLRNLTPEKVEELAGLRTRANDCHWQCVAQERRALPYAQASGDALINAKKIVGHGHWLQWLKGNFAGSPDTAERYMRLARNRDNLQPVLDRNPNLTPTEGLERCKTLRFTDDDAEPAPLKRDVVKVLTPIGEARRMLEGWAREEMHNLSDDKVMFLVKYGKHDVWNHVWHELRRELGLASLLLAARKRREEAMALLNAETDEGRQSDDEWQGMKDKIDRTFYRELVEGLEHWDEFSEFEKDIVFWQFGMHRFGPALELDSLPREEIRRIVLERIATDKLPKSVEHLVNLLNPLEEAAMVEAG
jgi:hypothetical protein